MPLCCGEFSHALSSPSARDNTTKIFTYHRRPVSAA
jgi:hypothetical protein